MWTRLRSLQFSQKTTPWVIIAMAILAYGLLTPFLGFYWDDWAFVWLLDHNGPVELARSFLPFDPLVSPFFLISSSLIGTSAFGWQVFGLLIRILVSLAALWTLNQIWPRHSRKVIWTALFFLVYPGYGQQWVAFTHANQEWISLGSMILSLGLTARSLREPASPKWFIFALIAQFIGLATTEYFLGMEFLRPVIIWIVTIPAGHSFQKQMIDTLKYWAAGYIPIWLLAGIGQYLYHRSSAYGGHSFGVDLSERAIPKLTTSFLRDIVHTLSTAAFEAWTQTFRLLTSPLSSLTDWLTLALTVISFLGLAFYFHRLQTGLMNSASHDTWALQAIALGLVGVLGGRIPSWMAGMPVALRFDWDRLLISMLFGASLLIAGLIDYLVRDGFRKELLISLILALAIGMQFQQANTFRRDWQNQKNFFWQLTWRAPSLKPGTMVLTEELPLQYVSDMQLSAPLNLIYATDASHFSYILLYRKNRLGGTLLPQMAPAIPAQGRYRTVTFQSTTSNIVMLVQPSDGCLQVLDPRYASEETLADLPQAFTENVSLSNIDQVENGNSANPTEYLGPEPAHTWCYYFEKAELARQFDNWEKVIEQYRSAAAAGYTSLRPSENLVFIEAFARAGDAKKASELTDHVLSQDRRLCDALLSTWERALDVNPAIGDDALKQMERLSDFPECR